MPNTTAHTTVRDLRRRWKPVKDRLTQRQADHPTAIRFHRACSWLAEVEMIDDGQDMDRTLIHQWIAFNALYGQWNERAAEPVGDRECWRRFLDRILALDRDSRLSDMLQREKRLVMAILDDAYLTGFFWKDPSTRRAMQTTRDKRNASTWYIEKRWALVLEQTVDRVYLLRCQLVHGAATCGGGLNRKSLRRCIAMMRHLLPVLLLVWIDHGSDEDWGPMCYPPVGR